MTQRAAERLPRIVYLGGFGRSGSTLIERLLGELPGVCAIGEAVHMWHRGIVDGERCGCGEPFPACAFWRRVGDTGFGGWDRVDAGRVARLRSAVDRNRFIPFLAGPALRPGFRRELDEYLSYYQRLYTAAGEVSGSHAIVDSSKHASLAFCLRRSPHLDVRVVHVVRDSRAVAHSWTTQVTRPDADAASLMRTYAPVTSAAHWNAQNLALHTLARMGTPLLRVRYEDLAADPEAVLRDIAAFAGLHADISAMRFLGGDPGGRWAELRPAHTASGNRMRFTTGRIAIKRDERWRAAMPAAQRLAVTTLTFPLLKRYGYVQRP
ncbi:MAG: sulfotransferase [Micromonosporaceae bacterium]